MHALILSLKASSKRLPRFDGVWLTSIVLLSGIGVFAAAQLAETLRFAFSSLIYMAPIMLVAISIAGSVRASGATSFVAKVFTGRMTRMVLIAALVGRREATRRTIFAQEAKGAAALMLKWLTLAFIIESLVVTYLPTELIAAYVGESSTLAIPIAVALGIPSYIDGYAALPLVRGLIELGMTPGAAMAFLVAGGITSLYASVAVIALVRLPVFFAYLGLAIAGSFVVGYLYQIAVS